MNIPKNTEVPVVRGTQFKAMIYGASKIGKTTFAASFPDALILSTDGNYKHLSNQRIDIKKDGNIYTNANGTKTAMTGGNFIKALCNDLKQDKEYKTVILDLFDDIVSDIETDIAKKFKSEHISDVPMGKGWGLAKDQAADLVRELVGTGKNVILLCREEEKEESDSRGFKFGMKRPAVRDKVLNEVLSYLDYTWRIYSKDVTDKDGKISTKRFLRLERIPHMLIDSRTVPTIEELELKAGLKPEQIEKLIKEII